VIIGAEMNAEIEHASEHGKAPGEKQPGGRKTIGARAAREFREKQQQGRLPGTSEAPVTLRPRRSPAAAFARTGVLFGGVVAALFGRRINQ
jgi:hypothetical protein